MIASLSSSSMHLSNVPAPLDEAALLSRIKGDMTFLHVIFEAFRTQYPEQRRELRTAFANHDLATVQNIAHSLKGNAGTLGGSRVAALAADVMAACSRSDSSDVPDLLRRLDLEVSSFQHAITDLLNK